jgi:histidyl-tRNA synthetase
MAQKLQTVRGVRDLIDSELETYDRVIAISSNIAKLHNYEKILLPIFEYSSVFLRTLGEESDIVTKETYTFSDRDKRSITLRPEFTASIVRSLISNGLTQNLPRRFFTYGPLFRHERPQQGRYRQFYQFDCELFGSSSHMADVEVINLLYLILRELKVENKITIEINSLGDKESTDNYRAVLREYFSDNINKLSHVSKERLKKNPLRILDSKEEDDIALVKGAPVLWNFLNQQSIDHFSNICETLDVLGIKYRQNPRLVRGLDYYTHTVFEFISNTSNKAIAAGGRYDKLVENMGGPEIPAVGFALGIDRLHDLLKPKKANPINNVCYLIPIGDSAELYGITLSNKLRNSNIITVLDYNISTKKRMKIADREKYPICIIFGEEEIENEELTVRDMVSSEETKVHIEELAEVLVKLLK